MMKLNRREKILLLFCLIAVFFYIFDLLYYKPRSKRIKAMEAESKIVDQKLQQLSLLIRETETIKERVKELESRLKRLNEKTVRGDELKAFLNHLAKESSPNLMKIISLKPFEEEISPGKKEGETGLTGKLKKINITMVLHSTFYKLQNYINEIEKLPFLIRIEGLQVEKDEEIYPLLKATLSINLFVSSKK